MKYYFQTALAYGDISLFSIFYQTISNFSLNRCCSKSIWHSGPLTNDHQQLMSVRAPREDPRFLESNSSARPGEKGPRFCYVFAVCRKVLSGRSECLGERTRRRKGKRRFRGGARAEQLASSKIGSTVTAACPIPRRSVSSIRPSSLFSSCQGSLVFSGVPGEDSPCVRLLPSLVPLFTRPLRGDISRDASEKMRVQYSVSLTGVPLPRSCTSCFDQLETI